MRRRPRQPERFSVEFVDPIEQMGVALTILGTATHQLDALLTIMEMAREQERQVMVEHVLLLFAPLEPMLGDAYAAIEKAQHASVEGFH